MSQKSATPNVDGVTTSSLFRLVRIAFICSVCVAFYICFRDQFFRDMSPLIKTINSSTSQPATHTPTNLPKVAAHLPDLPVQPLELDNELDRTPHMGKQSNENSVEVATPEAKAPLNTMSPPAVAQIHHLESSESAKRLRHGMRKETETQIQCPAEYTNPDPQLLKRRSKQGPVYSRLPMTSERVYLFLMNMPYSGSTALLSLLSSSPTVSNLCAGKKWACEGHYSLVDEKLIPSLQWGDLKNPAWPEDWNAALGVYEKLWNMSKKVFIDKSPPNVYKVARIARDLSAAGKRVKFIFLTRSPCYGLKPPARELLNGYETQPPELRLQVKYEDLVRDPYGEAQRILDFVPALQSLDPATYSLGRPMKDRDESLVDFIVHGHRRRRFHYKTPSVDRVWEPFMRTFGYQLNFVREDWESVVACKAACSKAGFCCARDSGCGYPSCALGCEIASAYKSKHECKSACSVAPGTCDLKPSEFSWFSGAKLCATGTCDYCGDEPNAFKDVNCEDSLGCSHGCDQFAY